MYSIFELLFWTPRHEAGEILPGGGEVLLWLSQSPKYSWGTASANYRCYGFEAVLLPLRSS